MILEILCSCGRRLAVDSAMAGKYVGCPFCGAAIAVPLPAAVSAVPIVVACRCGQQFMAQPFLAGKQVRCPMCRGPISVPPLQGSPPSAPFPPARAPQAPDHGSEDIYALAETPKAAPEPSTATVRPEYRPPRHRRKRPMPESTRTACFALATGGFLFTVFTGIGLYLISTDSVDALGKGLVGYSGCAAIGGYLSAVLVSQRIPLAIVPAMLVSLVYLVFFPLGTIVALIAFTKLSTEESRQYLAGDARSR